MLDEIVSVAQRLCEVESAAVVLVDGERLRVATYEAPDAGAPGVTLPLTRGSVNGRAIIDRRTVHVADLAPLIDTEYPDVRETQARGGHHAVVAAPLLVGTESIGSLSAWRIEAGPFTAEQIALL